MVTVLEVPDEHGDLIVYVTASEAPSCFSAFAKVTSAMVRDWKRRRLLTGYRIGKLTYYRLDELIEVEFALRSGGQGRPRSST